MCLLHFYTLFFLIVLVVSQSNIPIYDIRIGNLLKMQEGIGWPIQLNVVKGHEALMQLSSNLGNVPECKAITPGGIQFDVRNPPSNRYEHWSTGCGMRIKNVADSDNGRWRLIATRGAESFTGWIEVNIKDDTPSYAPTETIALQDGETHAVVDLTTLQNSYCLVTQPFSESSLVSGHCLVTLDRTTRAVQGRWDVVLGVPGRVSELQVERNVAVEAEQLSSGYREENDKIHLFCNILHTDKNITFCRFQKNAARAGYNIMDGLSDGLRSYFGDGFAKRQCGMTIERPNATDYVTWRCTVGLQERSGVNLRHSAPMQALIRVQPRDRSRAVRSAETQDEEIRTLFVQRDSNLEIMCRADASLSYCWFQHPNGSQFSPTERQPEEDRPFWYVGQNLQTGDCGINFAHVFENDAGDWICHMGPSDQLGVEITEKVIVRVTGPLAAYKREIDISVGSQAVLYCQTSNGPKPLDYCRFLSPNFVGISINSKVTSENPILGRFYFTSERSLDYGDCSLTINPVYAEDIGNWTCAALVHDHIEESRDNIVLRTRRNVARQAGIAVMSIAIGGLAILLVAIVWYRKGKPVPWRRSNMSDTAAFAFRAQNDSPTPRSSNSSGNSNENQTGRTDAVSESPTMITDDGERNASFDSSMSSTDIPIRSISVVK